MREIILLSVPSKIEALPLSDFAGKKCLFGISKGGGVTCLVFYPYVFVGYASKFCFVTNLCWNNFYLYGLLLSSQRQLIHGLLG